MFCPNCQNEINEDMNYCPHCGYQIKRCPHCHSIIKEGEQYCSTCGHLLHPNEQIGGYYQPLFYDEDPIQDEKPTSSFKDIPVNKKVNKIFVLICAVVLAILTAISYEYIYHGPSLNATNYQTDLPQADMVISQETNTSSQIGNINQNGLAYFDGENLYMSNDQGYLVSMDKNLDNRQTLMTQVSEYIQVYDNHLYYTDKNHYLCQASLNGEDQQTLISQAVYYVYVVNDHIYYQRDDDNESIYVYDLQTKQETKLNDRKSYRLNVVDQVIYYTSTDGIYRVQTDGKNDEKVLSGSYHNLIYQNGWLYYMDDEGTISCLDVENLQTDILKERAVQFLNINDQYLFYQSMDGSVVRYELSTKQEKTVYNGLVESGFIVGDKLILKTYASTYQQDSYFVIMDFDGAQQQRLFFDGSGDYI